jgi:hypothetical protein
MTPDASPREDVADAFETLGSEVPGPPPVAEERPYNPDRDREKMRGRIASGLLVLIGALTIASYALAVLGARSVDDVAKLHGLIVSPLLALTSGIVGFYFGTQTRRD